MMAMSFSDMTYCVFIVVDYTLKTNSASVDRLFKACAALAIITVVFLDMILYPFQLSWITLTFQFCIDDLYL